MDDYSPIYPGAPNDGDGVSSIDAVTGLQAALDGKAPLASPALTGTPTAPTAANGTNTTQIATTAFVLANGGGGGGTMDAITDGTTYRKRKKDRPFWEDYFGANSLDGGVDLTAALTSYFEACATTEIPSPLGKYSTLANLTPLRVRFQRLAELPSGILACTSVPIPPGVNVVGTQPRGTVFLPYVDAFLGDGTFGANNRSNIAQIDGFCLSQGRTGAGALVLNGAQAITAFAKPRLVTLTAGATDLSAVDITITGICPDDIYSGGYAATPITVKGPKANTTNFVPLVVTALVSVTTSATVANLQVGYGSPPLLRMPWGYETYRGAGVTHTPPGGGIRNLSIWAGPEGWRGDATPTAYSMPDQAAIMINPYHPYVDANTRGGAADGQVFEHLEIIGFSPAIWAATDESGARPIQKNRYRNLFIQSQQHAKRYHTKRPHCCVRLEGQNDCPEFIGLSLEPGSVSGNGTGYHEDTRGFEILGCNQGRFISSTRFLQTHYYFAGNANTASIIAPYWEAGDNAVVVKDSARVSVYCTKLQALGQCRDNTDTATGTNSPQVWSSAAAAQGRGNIFHLDGNLACLSIFGDQIEIQNGGTSNAIGYVIYRGAGTLRNHATFWRSGTYNGNRRLADGTTVATTPGVDSAPGNNSRTPNFYTPVTTLTISGNAISVAFPLEPIARMAPGVLTALNTLDCGSGPGAAHLIRTNGNVSLTAGTEWEIPGDGINTPTSITPATFFRIQRLDNLATSRWRVIDHDAPRTITATTVANPTVSGNAPLVATSAPQVKISRAIDVDRYVDTTGAVACQSVIKSLTDYAAANNLWLRWGPGDYLFDGLGTETSLWLPSNTIWETQDGGLEKVRLIRGWQTSTGSGAKGSAMLGNYSSGPALNTGTTSVSRNGFIGRVWIAVAAFVDASEVWDWVANPITITVNGVSQGTFTHPTDMFVTVANTAHNIVISAGGTVPANRQVNCFIYQIPDNVRLLGRFTATADGTKNGRMIDLNATNVDVDGFAVDGWGLADNSKSSWAVCIGGGGKVRNLKFATPHSDVGNDGFHCYWSPREHGVLLVENISGESGDDLCAIGSPTSFNGHIQDVRVDNVDGYSKAARTVAIFNDRCDYAEVCDITVTNATVTHHPSSNNQYDLITMHLEQEERAAATPYKAASLHHVTLRDFRVRLSAERTGGASRMFHAFALPTAGQTGFSLIDNVILERWQVTSSGTAAAPLACPSNAAFYLRRVGGIEIRDCEIDLRHSGVSNTSGIFDIETEDDKLPRRIAIRDNLVMGPSSFASAANDGVINVQRISGSAAVPGIEVTGNTFDYVPAGWIMQGDICTGAIVEGNTIGPNCSGSVNGFKCGADPVVGSNKLTAVSTLANRITSSGTPSRRAVSRHYSLTTPGAGNWTVPPDILDFTFARVRLIGPGGSGGSGASTGTSTSSVTGGGGGGGGAINEITIPVSALAGLTTVPYTVGDSGAGGTSVTNSATGNVGGTGSNTVFGATGTTIYLQAGAGGGGAGGGTADRGGGGGGSPMGIGGVGGAAAGVGLAGAGDGGLTTAGKSGTVGGGGGGAARPNLAGTGGGASAGAAGGGGGGGGLGAAGTFFAGGAGGGSVGALDPGGAGATDGAGGQQPSPASMAGSTPYGGSGGGASSVAGAGGAGAAGKAPGGAGGGGGAAISTQASGAGGKGGRGQIDIYLF